MITFRDMPTTIDSIMSPPNMLKFKYIDHLAYVFFTIEEGYSFFKGHPGFRVLHGPGLNKVQNVYYLFIHVEGVGKIEILAPIKGERNSPIEANLSKCGPGLYHICYAVDCVEETMRQLLSQGWKAICNPVPDPAFGGRRITFVFNSRFGLIELVDANIALPAEMSRLQAPRVPDKCKPLAEIPPSNDEVSTSSSIQPDQIILELIAQAVDSDSVSVEISSFDQIDNWDSLSHSIFHASFENLVDASLNPIDFPDLSHYVAYRRQIPQQPG